MRGNCVKKYFWLLLLVSAVAGAQTTPNLSFTSLTSGTNLFQSVNNVKFADQFTGATPAARASAALTSCGSNPCTVIVPSSESAAEILGNLTTTPTTSHVILDLRNSGPGSTQPTNWLLCDFSGTAISSPCRNPGGAQALQVGRTFTTPPITGNQVANFWGKFSGVSANTIAFPL